MFEEGEIADSAAVDFVMPMLLLHFDKTPTGPRFRCR